MIDKRYLETGLRIQQDAGNALQLLAKEEDKLKKINTSLLKVTEDLKDIKNKASDYPNVNALKEDVFKKLSDIETQSDILNRVIEPLNKKMESLRKEEDMLWDTIREKYPDKPEEEIITAFKEYIENNN